MENQTQIPQPTAAPQPEKIVDPNIGLESSYVKFEVGVRKRLSVTKWRTVETVKSFDDGKTNKTVVEWKADVIAEDRVPCKKTVSVGNISFRKQVNLLLAAKDPRTTVVAISAKRLGDGRSTTYDVELIADA